MLANLLDVLGINQDVFLKCKQTPAPITMTRISEKAEEKKKKISGTDKSRVVWALQLHVEIGWSYPLTVLIQHLERGEINTL